MEDCDTTQVPLQAEYMTCSLECLAEWPEGKVAGEEVLVLGVESKPYWVHTTADLGPE